MEQTVPITRKRRKRAHSTKCPCCSEEGEKPEKQPRRRREDNNEQHVGGPEENERLLKGAQLGTKTSSELSECNKPSSGNGTDEEDNLVNKGRLLRSGRSTPVSVELETNTVSQLPVLSSNIVKKRLASQKISKNGKQAKKVFNKGTDKSTTSSPVGFKPVSGNSKMRKVTSSKVKANRNQNNSAVPNSVEAQDQESNTNKKKLPVKNKLLKNKRAKLPPGKHPLTVKKTLAIERLKIRSFDNLKEKMENALGKSLITVPECVELLGKITSTHLKEILEDVAEDRNELDSINSKLDEDLTDEKTESGSETQIMEGLAENLTESEAAKALVSFKVQTTTGESEAAKALVSFKVQTTTGASEAAKALVSFKVQTTTAGRSSCQSETFPHLSSSKEQTSSLETQKTSSLQNMNNIAATSVLPSSSQTLRETEVAVTAPAVVPSALPSVSLVQSPLTFKLLQVPGQVSRPSLPGGTTQFQQTPGFLYQKPTTMLNTLVPVSTTSGSQHSNTILHPPFKQLLYVAKVKQQHEPKSQLNSSFPVFLPGKKTQDQVFPTSSFSTAAWSTMANGTNLMNSTISPVCPVSASTTEVQSSIKLRPILPKEPYVAIKLSLFEQSSTGISLPPIAASNVKQAVKRLVSERSKSNDPSAITFTATNSNSLVADGNSHVDQECRDFTEMKTKEQAIKGLLSIGGDASLPRGARQMDGLGNRPYDSNVTSKLKIVFDTDKGIFKVDDVTIDPQVNTIGKESYTCGKCGKIFTSLSYLARHIKRVCPDMSHRKWKCNHCEKAFRHPLGLQQHIYTHTGERPHKCPQCPKAFYSSNDLRRHSRIHSGERPYMCKQCGKTFATTISLKTHTFIHTGEKPHRCPHCTKTFATSSKLGRHVVTHGEERRYSCRQCSKTFNRSGDLRRHNVQMHNPKFTEDPNSGQDKEKIYKCTECSSSFDTAKQLEVHINEHKTENGHVE